MAKEITLTISNKKGLHARAAAKFVNTVNAHEANVRVAKLSEDGVGESVGGSSILGLMMLGADLGSKLYIVAEGAQEEKVIAALEQLLANKFGEGE